MKEKDDLTVLRLAAGTIDSSAGQNSLTAPNSSNDVVTTALLRKLWVRRKLNELGEECSCGSGLDFGEPAQLDGKGRTLHTPFVVGELAFVAHQLLLGIEELLRAIALIDGLPAAQCEAEAGERAKILELLNLICVRLARAELAAQHVLLSGTDNLRPR